MNHDVREGRGCVVGREALAAVCAHIHPADLLRATLPGQCVDLLHV